MLKIAIVGATTPGSMVWDRDNLAAAKLTVRDIVPEVREAVADARGTGASVIIVARCTRGSTSRVELRYYDDWIAE